jgi:hypothetical protein
MGWSKNPLVYPKLFHDLLQAAEEGRAKVVLSVTPGKAAKYKFQFYAFKWAWESKAERSRRLQNFVLAAAEEAKAAKLGRYIPIVEVDRITFVNKDVVMMEEGATLTVSDEFVSDSPHETIDLVAQDQASREEVLAMRKERRKGGSPAVPAAMRLPTAPPENLAQKLFGVDTSKPREFPLAPVPQSEEEKTLMEQIRREMEESGDKHGDET